jgi:hypothetical protein
MWVNEGRELEAVLLVEMGPEIGPGLEHPFGARNLEEVLLAPPVSRILFGDGAEVVRREKVGTLCPL